uniref:Uncharacterized protein n=1 Tax=Arundo donax TaxID=35708 RepID=A0A0A9CKJ5_ARUDO
MPRKSAAASRGRPSAR